MESLLPSASTRKRIVVLTLLFCWSVIAYLIFGGDPLNSLHTSALAWAFATSGGVIGAYVFGSVYDNQVIVNASANAELQKKLEQ
jgi:hypothetical protein